MIKEGSLNESAIKPEIRNETVLEGSDWQKIAFQMRGQAVRQLSEVAQYCKEQRKSKRPANILKNTWARSEISALSAILGALKDIELEVMKSKIEVLENSSSESEELRRSLAIIQSLKDIRTNYLKEREAEKEAERQERMRSKIT